MLIIVLLIIGCGYTEESDFLSASGTTNAALVPETISGLTLWLRADAITGLSNGDPIDQWTDLSGNGNNATQTGANRPAYQTGILNGNPVVRFNGTSNNFIIPSIDMQPATVFVVGRYTAPVTNAPFLGNDTNNSFFGYYTTSIYYYSTIANLSVVDANPTDFEIITGHARSFGSNSSIFINGSSVVSGNYNWAASSFIYIARRNAERFRGDIAEIIIYNRDLNTTERQQVEDYLNSKYQIY